MPVPDVDEVDPLGIVREQRVSVQVIEKDLGQVAARLAVRQSLERGPLPGLFVTLDDEGAGRLVELIGVSGKDTRLRLAEGEREPVKELARAVPDVLVAAHAQGGLKEFSIPLPDGRVNAVSADEQV